MSRLVVIGGGLSGLSLVHYLKHFAQFYKKTRTAFSKITLLESNDYLGGSVQTKRYNDGVLHELGPRSVRLGNLKADNSILLVEQLGLANQLQFIQRASPAGKNRYIYCNEKLYQVPSSLKGLFSKLPISLDGKQRRIYQCILQDWRKRQPLKLDEKTQDISVYEFFNKRFGKDIAEFLIVPLCRGISAGDAHQLSMRSMFGEFLDHEQTYGSLIRGILKPQARPVDRDSALNNEMQSSRLLHHVKSAKTQNIAWNLAEGLQLLPQRMCDSIMHDLEGGDVSGKKIEVYNQSRVIQARLKSDGTGWAIKVATIDGETLELDTDHLFAAIPSVELAKILKFPQSSSGLDEISRKLSEIKHYPVACVCLEFDRNELNIESLGASYQSFGFLTHPELNNNRPQSGVLGVTFDSITFGVHDANQPIVRMTVMIGGAWHEQFELENLGENKDKNSELQKAALEALQYTMGIKTKPRRCYVKLWSVGIANYQLGHQKDLNLVRQLIHNNRIPLTLLGQSYDGFSVNDVIYNSRLSAHAYIQSISSSF